MNRFASCIFTATNTNTTNARGVSSQSINKNQTDVLVICAGIAGMCTSHYLLRNSKCTRVTLIDKESDIASLTSRINGGLICPSLSTSWTNYPIFTGNDSLLSMILSTIKGKQESSLLSFDPKLLTDKRFLSFISAWARRKPLMNNANDAISDMGYLSMDCFNNDNSLKSIDYDRAATGTKTDKGLSNADSSGDAYKFCNGLRRQILELHGYGENCRFRFIPNTIVDSFLTNNEGENKRIDAVNLIDSRNDNTQKKQCWDIDNIVISAGNQSYDICSMLGIPCPIFPVKGYIIAFHSKVDIDVNLQLGASKAFVSPLGNNKYHLSGCADFTSHYNNAEKAYEIDKIRVDTLINEARATFFPDMKVQSMHCGHRPLSPDDIPIIGSISKYDNVFLNTGSGSKGWTQGKKTQHIFVHLL